MAEPTDTAALVSTLANAYRETVAEGDRRLAGNDVERKLLQAIVASSAVDALNWVQTRLRDGQAVGRPLEELALALGKGNVVGASMTSARNVAVKQAKAVVMTAVTGATMPAWVASFIAFLAGLFAVSQNAGAAVGAAVAPLLIGGSAVVGGVVRLLQASGGLATAVGEAAGSLLDSTERLGWQAEALYREKAEPALAALVSGAGGGGGPRFPPILGQVRGSAKAVVLVAYVLLGACVLFFGYGVFNAFSAVLDPQTCQLRRTDGSCLISG